MTERISVLIISGQSQPAASLKPLLQSHSVDVHTADSCGEALPRMWGEDPPHLVFTDLQLKDGTWLDALSVAKKSPATTHVIVVSAQADVNLYIQSIERGAFDFVVPPLSASEIEFVLRSAICDVQNRRKSQADVRRFHTALSQSQSRPMSLEILSEDDPIITASL
jgi:DNA-binding NtrC family response regulator